VTSFVEFDPKSADPAKPQLVYRELMAALEFPIRDDGSRSLGFYDLVKEVRDHWSAVRGGKLFKRSPWWSESFRILQAYAHSDGDEYRQAMGWLPSFSKDATALNSTESRFFQIRERLSFAILPIRRTGGRWRSWSLRRNRVKRVLLRMSMLWRLFSGARIEPNRSGIIARAC
jgi:hypothetical protein